jgi:hypothetical protein
MAENAYCVNLGLPIFTPKDIPFNQLKNENATYTVDGYQTLLYLATIGIKNAIFKINIF